MRAPRTARAGDHVPAFRHPLLLCLALPALADDAAPGARSTSIYDKPYITGSGGGEWTVCVADGAVQVKEGLHDPAVTTTCSAKDWIAITLGKLDGMMAFSSGRLKVEGDMGLLTKAARFFKKYQAPSAGAPDEETEPLVRLNQVLSIPQRFATGPVMGKFLNAFKEKRILANKCPQCGRLQLPPREICAECRVRATEWVEVGPEGVIATPDITYYASPDPLTGETRETPYISAHFLLKGCKDHETLWHELKMTDFGFNPPSFANLFNVANDFTAQVEFTFKEQ